MELTAKNVEDILVDCLFQKDEDTSKAIIVEGVTLKIGFHPERLEKHKVEITKLLSQLPGPFHEGHGDGFSFLGAIEDKDGKHWGEHQSVDKLLCLGLATKRVEFLLPREFWSTMPGGLPYFVVRNTGNVHKECAQEKLEKWQKEHSYKRN